MTSISIPTVDELDAMLRLDLVVEPPRRREVVHLYWVGREKPWTLCGLPHDPSWEKVTDSRVQVVGGLMPLPEARDCKNCLRVLEAAQRRGYVR